MKTALMRMVEPFVNATAVKDKGIPALIDLCNETYLGKDHEELVKNEQLITTVTPSEKVLVYRTYTIRF